MDLTKRLFVTGALAAFTALAPGCARFVDLVRTYSLAVTDGNTHPYTYLTQEEGERQLQGLVCSLDTRTEDAWVFIRDVNAEVGRWVDVCYDLREDSCRFDMNLFFEEVIKERSSELGKVVEVTPYHIHPLLSVLDYYKGVYGGNGHKELEQYDLEVFSMPGYRDMLGHMLIENVFSVYPSSRGDLFLKKSKVVVPTGVFTYRAGEYFRGMCKNKTSDYVTENVFLPAIVEGVNKKDINETLKVLRGMGIDIAYERTKVFSRPVPLE